jgi:hypothetical protein
MAGDGDYVPLLEETKRGKLAFGSFFRDHATSPEMALACDTFFDIDDAFKTFWTAP